MGRLGAWLAVLAMVALCAGEAPAQSKKKKLERKLAKVSKKLGVPVEALRAVGGERYGSRKIAVRRALMQDIAAKPLSDLTPLVIEVAKKEKDFDARRTAVQVLAVMALDGDRQPYLEVIHPTLAELSTDKFQLVREDAIKQIVLLMRWYRQDMETYPILEQIFDGKVLLTAVEGWAGILELVHPDLRAGLVLRAMQEVMEPRSRFSYPQRNECIEQNGLRGSGQPLTPKEIAFYIVGDGTLAVQSAIACGRLGDAVALTNLRKINRTSAHVLRIPALKARAQLGDETLLGELDRTLDSDHLNIKRALIDALSELEHPKVDPVLARLSKGLQEKTLLLEVAFARLVRDDPADVARLGDELGLEPNAAVANRLLGIEHEALAPLVVRIAEHEHETMRGARRRAVQRIGLDGIQDGEQALRALQEGDKRAIRLDAAASLVQLGAKEAVKLLDEALKDYAVVGRQDIKTPCGVTKRFRGSPLIGVFQRFAQAETVDAIPIIARWLDPAGEPEPEPEKDQEPAQPAPTPAATPTPQPETTRERGQSGGEGSGEGSGSGLPAIPERAAWLRHQFVRREAVRTLGALIAAAEARLAAEETKPEEKTRLQALLPRGLEVLVLCLEDERGVVRRAATRGFLRLAGESWTPGASLEEEAEALATVRGWLRKRGLIKQG